MSNLDKKIICVLLIMNMLLVFFTNIANAVEDTNSEELTITSLNLLNQEIDETKNYEDIKFSYDNILTAKCDLDEIDSENLITKKSEVEGNVSKYVYESNQKPNKVDSNVSQYVYSSNSKKMSFYDVSKKSWFYNAVEYVFSNNIIKGYNETTFAPNDQLTRGMLVTILHRMEGSPKVSGTTKFPDVKNSKDYYYSAVTWATDNKIVSGYGNGKFGPNDNITREDLAVILYKYAKYKGKNTLQTNNLSDFSDRNQVSSYAVNQVKWAVGAEVVSGNADKTLNPKGYTTRAEASAMLEKYCKKIGK